MKFKIKIIFDVEENQYCVFVDGLRIEGYGDTEEEAMNNFLKNYETFKDKHC